MFDSSNENSRERINLILKTVFELLWFEPEGLYISEIIKYLKATIAFTEFETGYYPFAPYIPRYEVIMRVGTIPLVKAGWLEKTKNGRWFITTTGRNACYKFKGSEEFFKASIQLFQEWKSREYSRLTLFDEDPYNTAKDFSSAQIKQYLEVLDINDIRIIVTSLLKALGCHIVWTVPFKEDNSPIDMICSLDPLAIKPPRILVHISKCSEITTSANIDDFSKKIELNDIGMYISFGGFSDGAQEHAIELTRPQIRLFDLQRFIDLWVDNIGKIDQVGYSKLPLRPIHFLGIPGHLKSPSENRPNEMNISTIHS
jgi:restriction endonuclease Mrr